MLWEVISMMHKDLYIAELVFILNRFVQEDITVHAIKYVKELPAECYLSQNIVGDYEAYTAIYGSEDALNLFAKKYSEFNMLEFNELSKEVILDFLNLLNGNFVVNLSAARDVECTLTLANTSNLSDQLLFSDTCIIPIDFVFGQINFVFSEN